MNFKLNRFTLSPACIFLLAVAAFAQNTGGIRGTVTDPSGALIPGATVAVTGSGVNRQAKTDNSGTYTITGLPSGKFNLRGDAKGFVTFLAKDVAVATGVPSTLDIPMSIATDAQAVQVSDNSATSVSVDPSQNVGAIVLGKEDIDNLPDDPDDLQSDLQALAGPSAGPNGAQFFIDGFSGGSLPPKSSIREIRINSNPFSAEFDRPGFGRIEIFTKPGTDKFHGSASFNFGDKFLNSRNPLLTTAAPDYISKFYSINFGGALTKKSSFTLDMNKRQVDDNALIKGLDPANNFLQTGTAVVTPQRFTSINPRIDYAINAANTLVVRYHWTESINQNAGLNGFALISQAQTTANHANTIQATETSIIGTKAVNETRFQYDIRNSNQNGSGVGGPTINVQSAFTSGGAPLLANFTHIRSYELANTTTMTQGRHAIKFGVRVRGSDQDQNSTSNYNGNFTFNSLANYQAGLPSQFTLSAGTPLLNVNQFDAGVFVADDYRIRPNLTISAGLRYEAQTNIGNAGSLAPRLSFAWAPFARGNKASKTVVRVGYGFFFDRVDDNLTLNTYRYNGTAVNSYLVNDPATVAAYYQSFPTLASLAANRVNQTIYKMDDNIKSPVLRQLAVGIDQQLPYKMTMTVNYVNSRGVHEQRTRNINAPFPATYDPTIRGSGIRPYGAAVGDLYLYESSGLFKQQQLNISVNARINPKVSLSGFYSLGDAHSNANGFPSNQYNTGLDWGRSNFDVRHRVGIFGNVALPLRLTLAPIITMASGGPFNITTGQDLNGDGIFNDRPAFATATSRSVKATQYGSFDLTPVYGTPLVPINYLQAPGNVSINLRLSRTFGWGEKAGSNPNAQQGGGMDGGARGGGARGPRSSGGFGGGMMGMGGGGASSGKKYSLTTTIEARNAINHVNYGAPTGNLLSPYFGQSTTLAGGFGGGGGGGFGGGNSAAGNRKVTLSLRFSF